jgi:hypothetical protein
MAGAKEYFVKKAIFASVKVSYLCMLMPGWFACCVVHWQVMGFLLKEVSLRQRV